MRIEYRRAGLNHKEDAAPMWYVLARSPPLRWVYSRRLLGVPSTAKVDTRYTGRDHGHNTMLLCGEIRRVDLVLAVCRAR